MREDCKITKKAFLYSSKRFNILFKCARQELASRFVHLKCLLPYNSNRFFRKHLGFEYSGSYNQNYLPGCIVVITDERKFTLLKLKYGI